MNLNKKNFCCVIASNCVELLNDNLAVVDIYELQKQVYVYQDLCETFDYLWLSLLIKVLAVHISEKRYEEARQLASDIKDIAEGLK